MNVSEYYRKHYGQLQGLTVINVQMVNDDDGDDVWPVFIMGRDDGKGGIVEGSHVQVMLSRDPEGNGAGFAFITSMGI